MRATVFSSAALAALVVLSIVAAGPASAELKVFKYDQFAPNIAEAANQVNGLTLAVQPGFAGGEAFGQVYYPNPSDFPVKLLGIDMILGAPPAAPTLTTHARIEIWNDESHGGATPQTAQPIYTIDTNELFNPVTGGFGVPLQGGVGLSIDFDNDNPENAPPIIYSGRIFVMIRFVSPAQNLMEQWGTVQCFAVPEVGVCGCQPVGLLVDQTSVKDANVLHVITPLGTCSGQANSWSFAEQIGVTGDAILRLRADVTGSCVADCQGKQCGLDGCGGVCGQCGAGLTCDDGQCVSVCTPACGGVQCGPDGCGGVCGQCGAGLQCLAGQCVAPCTPACGGIECGDDGCGGSCGACSTGTSCEGGFCVADCAPECGGKQCGDDGCGGQCGLCGGNLSCDDGGQCVAPLCVPDCAGRDCGEDGCGGSCGECAASESCEAGACVSAGPSPEPRPGPGDTPTLTVTAVSPAFATVGEEAEVSIVGSGFTAGMTARLGGTALQEVQTVGSGLITARVPASLAPGTYLLVVVRADEATASLPDAFEVRAASGTCGDGVCATGETCESCPEDCGPCAGAGAPPEGTSSGGCSQSPEGAAPVGLAVLLAAFALARPRRRAPRR